MERFTRFCALIEPLGDVVEVALEFRQDDEGRCRVEGSAKARVGIECGRCLLPQPRSIDVPIDLVLVSSDDEARAIGGDADPFVLEGEEVPVVDLLEDDLILALPGEACVEPETCPNRPALDYPPSDADDSGERASPFASLADLVGKRS